MTNQDNGKIGLPVLLAFSTPNIVVGTVITALSVVIPAFYAKYTMATLASIGTALFVARLIEAVIDPMAGYLSDRTVSRLGPRKPWLLAGSAVSPVFVYLLFNPSSSDGGLYFFVCYQCLVLASWTTIIIPYRAWAVDLTRNYEERSRIFVYLGVAYGIGAIFFAVFPFLPFVDSVEMSPANISWIGWVLIVSFPLSGLLVALMVPVRIPVAGERSTLRGLMQSVIDNGPFVRFLAAFLIGGMGQGIVLACFFFFLDAYLGIGDGFPLALLTVYVTAMCSMPIWLRLIDLVGKHRVWAIGWGGAAVLGLCLAFIPRGPDGLVPLLIIIGLYGACSFVEQFAMFAVLGDVIDYDSLRTGVNRSGNYNAITVLCGKINIAIGGALAYLLLDLFEYDVTGQANTPASEAGFLATFVALPAILYAGSSIMIWRFPIDRRKHDVIRRRLEQRERRLAASEAGGS